MRSSKPLSRSKSPKSRREFLQLSGAGLAALWLAGCGDAGEIDRLSFLNWQDYVDPTLLEEFTARTGITITYETYESNDDLARRLDLADRVRRGGRSGASTFDLIVPSDNFVSQFRRAGLLQELDAERLPGLANLAAVMRQSASDPGNRFSVPWATGTTGIGYDAAVFSEPPTYDVFLDPTYEGKMTVLNETRDALGLALLAGGADPNTTDQATIDAAADLLLQMKPNLRGFDSATYLDGLADGSLVAAQAYSSDLLIAKEQNPNLAFTIPDAGGLRWVDSICIPDGARSPNRAHELIDYFLEPEVAAAQMVAIGADNGNEAALEFLPADLAANPIIFPGSAALDGAVFLDDLGDDESRYASAWKRVIG